MAFHSSAVSFIRRPVCSIKNFGHKVLNQKKTYPCFIAGSLAVPFAWSSLHAKEDVGRIPKFSLDGYRYDQTTFEGRLKTMLQTIDPRTLLIDDKELQMHQDLLADFKKSGKVPAGKTDEDLWASKAVVDAIVHPVTGEVMLSVGRMSAFIPVNIPICFGMLTLSSTPAGMIFWQWLNQSWNVLNNYTNRSSAAIEWGPLAMSYCLAVSAAVSIGLGASKLVKKVKFLQILGPFVPYLAVISAGSCNVAFTRMEEMRQGVSFTDENGKVLGVSKKAGQIAVFNTVTTRSVFLPIPILVVPPLVMMCIPAVGLLRTLIEVSVIGVCVSIGLPCALALQPQRMALDVTSLEPEFHDLKDANGNPIKTVYANKGL